MDADAIVVGAGLAGLAATAELARAGRRVLLLDQEPESNLGGQAFWSFGGLFLVGTPEQRRMGIRDSRELAWQDWLGSAFFDRGVDDPSGGIGGNLDLVRENWPDRLGPAPDRMICGVPEHVDGRMLAIAERAGGRLVNRDRMWHYTEGIQNWDPIWARHGIRILPGPSSLWFDARGRRFPAPHFPGFDTLGTLAAIRATGFDYSWFVLTQKIIEKEFALSGSEQNPDLTGKDIKLTLSRVRPGAPAPVEAFKQHGADFVVARTLPELVAGMNKLTTEPLLELADLERQIVARDREIDNPFTKDLQVMAIRNARRSRGERLARTAAPHKILDPKAGPLIAVRLNILTRKTLGGLQTDLSGRVIGRRHAAQARARPVRGG